ncbi:MAG: S-layer homology domain-containing protein [Clostridia bacterium]|nr:S-layer homology domain-containing protein [Clostridia bacterium]
MTKRILLSLFTVLMLVGLITTAAYADDSTAVAAIGSKTYSSLADAVSEAQDGDMIVITEDGTYELPSFGKTLTVKAAEGVEATVDNIGAKALSGAKATFENLTFDYYPNVNYTGLQHIDAAVYNNCTFNGQVFLYGNSEIFNGCTFNQNSADAYNVWTYGAAKVEFNGCSFNCEGKSVLVYNEGGRATELTVTDTDFIADTVVDGKAAIEIDTSSPNRPGAMNGTSIIIDDKTTAVGFDRGSVSGEVLWNDKKNLENLEVWVNDIKVWPKYVAKVGENEYRTLAEAVSAANAAVGGATVELIGDADLGEKLIITGNVTISGEYTITRAGDYTGTLFAVGEGASLTLDGGLTVDGGNEYVFDSELYAEDLANWETSVPSAESAKWFTPEEGAPAATAYMITVSGTDSVVNLKDVSITNHYSTNGSGIVSAGTGATVNLDGAQITHNASTSGSGLVVNASSGKWDTTPVIWVNMNEGTVIDSNHVGGNHGIFKVYMGTYLTMNGGEIKNTTGWNSNGTVVGIYWASFEMNGGTICSNSSVVGPNNGRNAAIYGHSNHSFVMNGGTICHNVGRSKAGVDSPYSEIGYTASTVINGGTIVYNDVLGTWSEPDVSGGGTLTIKGGIFTQDVTKYCAIGYEAVYNEKLGVYTIEQYYAAEYNGVQYLTIQDAINAVGKGSGTVKILRDHEVDVNVRLYTHYPVLINGSDITLDLNGKTVTFDYIKKSGETVYSSISIYNGGSLTILDSSDEQTGTLYNKSAIDEAPRIVWVTSAGSLVIEGGRFVSEQADTMFYTSNSNANIPTTLYVKGGYFEHTIPTDGGTYDCFNQQDGYQKQIIELSGGTFNHDPTAGRQNEWEVTIATNYKVIDNGDGTWTVGKDGDITVTFANTNISAKTIPSATVLEMVQEPKKRGYIFAGWYANESLTKEFDFNTVLYDDTTIYAKWEENTDTNNNYWYILLMQLHNQEFDITAHAGEGGTVTPEGTYKVKYDKNITYTITPDEGYSIADVLIDGKSAGAVSEYTFKNVKKDHTITAVFEKIAWNNPFDDVAEKDWFYEDVRYVNENGLMIGRGTAEFSPAETVNRAMLVTVLWRLEDSPVVVSDTHFSDVPDGEWYTNAINWASENGIVLGYSDSTFRPTNELTREQVMAILHRYAIYKEYDDSKIGENATAIMEQCVYSDWAKDDIIWADRSGMFNGIGVDITDMKDEMTRAEIAAYFRRFCENVSK